MKINCVTLLIILLLGYSLPIYSMRYQIGYGIDGWVQQAVHIANEIKNKHGDTCDGYHKASLIVEWLQKLQAVKKQADAYYISLQKATIDSINTDLETLANTYDIDNCDIKGNFSYQIIDYTNPLPELSSEETSANNQDDSSGDSEGSYSYDSKYSSNDSEGSYSYDSEHSSSDTSHLKSIYTVIKKRFVLSAGIATVILYCYYHHKNKTEAIEITGNQ